MTVLVSPHRASVFKYKEHNVQHNEQQQQAIENAGLKHVTLDEDDFELPSNPQTDVKVCGLEEGCTSCQ